MGNMLPRDFSVRTPEYHDFLPKNTPSNPEISNGKLRALEVVAKLREAAARSEQIVAPPTNLAQQEIQDLYSNNPGHIPYLDN